MNKCVERLYNGIVKENPTLVLTLGMCPTLAVTTSAINGAGMGLASTVVLALSNLIISMLRNVIPDRVRMPAYIVIVASFVTIVQFLMQGFVSKNKPLPSLFDGIGMGLGFTCSLTVLGAFREILGAGTVFGHSFIPANNPTSFEPISIFVMAPGAFFVLAMLVAVMNRIKRKKGRPIIDMCRDEGCMGCANLSCAGRRTVKEGEE